MAPVAGPRGFDAQHEGERELLPAIALQPLQQGAASHPSRRSPVGGLVAGVAHHSRCTLPPTAGPFFDSLVPRPKISTLPRRADLLTDRPGCPGKRRGQSSVDTSSANMVK